MSPWLPPVIPRTAKTLSRGSVASQSRVYQHRLEVYFILRFQGLPKVLQILATICAAAVHRVIFPSLGIQVCSENLHPVADG
jgi:hypothetical protein